MLTFSQPQQPSEWTWLNLFKVYGKCGWNIAGNASRIFRYIPINEEKCFILGLDPISRYHGDGELGRLKSSLIYLVSIVNMVRE